MPKLKSNKGAMKRFKKRGKGFKHKRANLKHILTKKSQKRKRNLRKKVAVAASELPNVKRLIRGS